MANVNGKKRAKQQGKSAGSSSGSSKNAAKLANKRASAKHASRGSAAKMSSGSRGKTGADPVKETLRRPPTVAKKDKDGKEKVKRRGLREFVDIPGASRQHVAAQEDDGEDGSEEDESDIDVQDMLPNDDGDDSVEDDTNSDNSDQENVPTTTFAQRAQFLTTLDTKGLSKSRSFIQNEYKVSKPPLEKPSKADKAESSTLRVPLPKIAPAPTTVNSDGEEDLDALDEDDFANLSDSDLEWDSDDDLSVDEDLGGSDNLGDSDSIESDDLQDDADEWEGLAQSDSDASSHTLLADSDEEGLEDRYANIASKKQKRIDAEKAANGPSRLPVIMDGEVVQHKATKSKTEETEQNRISHKRKTAELSDEEADEEETLRKRMRAAKPKLNPLGARFGRPAVSSVLEIEDLGMRIQAAREELAVLGRDIIAEPEMSLNLLKRLQSFTMPVFLSPGEKREEGRPIDAPIRSLAMLSLLAVFLDIIPGYRIRQLTEVEKSARTTQAVMQQREYEEGLVTVYRKFLENCENEIRSTSNLAPIALRCLCELIKEKGYFNFAINIIEVLVKTLAKRDFDELSEIVVTTLSNVLLTDATGETSLEIVRMVSRTIKGHSYLVHPAMLSALLCMRFPDLGRTRASTDRIDKGEPANQRNGYKHDKHKGKGGKQQPYINKKARKAMNEKREITKEIQEAELTVSAEDRARNSTESLKLQFALYLRILKLPVDQKSELLPAALEGLARFSQLVNVDFFRDLLAVLKSITTESTDMRTQLLCIACALDLLSGQGEALNLDLSAFVSLLYALIATSTLSTSIEDKPTTARSTLPRLRGTFSMQTQGDLLFRCLRHIFLTSRQPNSPVRVMAFSKRILIAALHWPKQSALAALDFIRQLLVKERSLEAMLNTDDQQRDGMYKYETTDESLSNPRATVWWELSLLEESHFDEEVRAMAARLARWSKDE